MFSWLQSHVWLCTYIIATLAIMTFLLNFVFKGRKEKSHRETNNQEIGVHFTDEEIEILRRWTHSKSLEAHKVLTKEGTTFIVGGVQYEITSPRQEVIWNDFFDRMLAFGFIDEVRINGRGEIVYQLKNPAFVFIDSLS